MIVLTLNNEYYNPLNGANFSAADTHFDNISVVSGTWGTIIFESPIPD